MDNLLVDCRDYPSALAVLGVYGSVLAVGVVCIAVIAVMVRDQMRKRRQATNVTPADRAHAALAAVVALSGKRYTKEPSEERIADLIADLMHAAEATDLYQYDVVDNGARYYEHDLQYRDEQVTADAAN